MFAGRSRHFDISLLSMCRVYDRKGWELLGHLLSGLSGGRIQQAECASLEVA